MVLCGVITEYQVGRLPFIRPIKSLSFETSTTKGTETKPPFVNDFRMAKFGHVLAIGGTIIWGFGDKFLFWMQNT